MTYVFDIDGTVCLTDKNNYDDSKPIQERILLINKLYEQGNYIKFFTARGMSSKNGDIKQVYESYYDMTDKQLKSWGIKYHELILGKPSADFYIDDKGINDVDFFRT